MSAASKTPYASPSPRTVSRSVTTVTAVVTAITMSASGEAPTPLYHQYQESFGLTPFTVTIIFAAYVLSLLMALLTVGSLSDYIGRLEAPKCRWYRRTGESLSRPSCLHRQ